MDHRSTSEGIKCPGTSLPVRRPETLRAELSKSRWLTGSCSHTNVTACPTQALRGDTARETQPGGGMAQGCGCEGGGEAPSPRATSPSAVNPPSAPVKPRGQERVSFHGSVLGANLKTGSSPSTRSIRISDLNRFIPDVSHAHHKYSNPESWGEGVNTGKTLRWQATQGTGAQPQHLPPTLRDRTGARGKRCPGS